VVGLHHVRDLLEDDELIIVDGTRGVIIVDPDEQIVEEYRLRRSELEIERSKLNRLRDTRATTLDGEEVRSCSPTSRAPRTCPRSRPPTPTASACTAPSSSSSAATPARRGRAVRSLPRGGQGPAGKPVTIRTFDVGADKALNGATRAGAQPGARPARGALLAGRAEDVHDPAARAAARLGARQAADHDPDAGARPGDRPVPGPGREGQGRAARREDQVRRRHAGRRHDRGPRRRAVAGHVHPPLAFLSIGTNDLIQYTLAIDRSDEAVAHLYDPLHPAVLKLIAGTIATGARFGLPVSVCGEMAGDPLYTELLLGMGLRNFSMHPGNILEIKQQILRADLGELAPKVQRILKMDEPARIREAVERVRNVVSPTRRLA
jgi:phosphotransferase system enzyme I (PtsI)